MPAFFLFLCATCLSPSMPETRELCHPLLPEMLSCLRLFARQSDGTISLEELTAAKPDFDTDALQWLGDNLRPAEEQGRFHLEWLN